MRCTVVLLSICLITIITASPASPNTTPEAAWTALWSNNVAEAEQLFRSSLEDDDDNPDAWRGLLLTQLLMGYDDKLVETIDQYGKRTRGEPCDWYLTQTIDASCGLDSRDHYSSLYQFAKRLNKVDDLPAIDRRLALNDRMRYAIYRGDISECEKLSKELGYVKSWSLVGPFDNTSGSGHGRMHIDNWNYGIGSYKGKFSQIVTWFNPKLTGIDGVITPTNYFHEDQETTAYLRTVIEVQKTDRYLISLSHEGDIKMWIDGFLVFEGDRKVGGEEIGHWDVQLDEGNHLVTVQLSNRGDSSEVALGISDLEGKKVNTHEDPTVFFGIADVPELDFNELKPEFEAVLAQRAERALTGEGNPEDVFWALRQAIHTVAPDSTFRLCKRIEEKYPDTAALLLACGMAYGAQGEGDDAKRAMEVARGLDSSLAVPQLYAVQEDLRKKRYDSSIAVCDSILTMAPRCTWALSLKLDAMLGQHDLEAVEELAQKIVRQMPDDPIGYDYLASWAEARGMTEDAREFESQALRRRPPLNRHFQQLFQRMQQDDYEQAKETIEELIGYTPDQSWLWSSLVQSLIAKGDYEEALDTIDEVLVSFPQDVDLLYYKALFAEADAYLYRGIPDGKAYAAEIINQALNFSPGNLPLRDKYRTLSGLTPYREYLPSPDIGESLARRVEPEDYPSARAVVLREWRRRLFYEDGVSLQDYYFAVQVLTKAGVEAWEKYRLRSAPLGRVMLEQKTVKPDGTENDATLYGDQVHFVNLEPGDIVVLHYQSTHFRGGLLKGQAWDKHRFAYADPCIESSFELIAPNNFEIDIKLHNDRAHGRAVEVSSDKFKDGYSVRSWTLRDIEGLDIETNSTNALSYQTWLDLSTVPSWQSIATWYGNLAAGQAEISRPVREKAEELCADASDPEEKVERIYRFVSQDVNYVSVPFYMSAHVPREAEEVLESRYGDCKDKSCLMIAMLQAVGIDDARFALIDTWGSRGVEMLPSPRFNHAIVCRPDGQGGYRWFDPTIKYGTSRQIPGSLIGGLALIADPETDKLTVIESVPVDAYPSHMSGSVDVTSTGTARIHRRTEDMSMNITASRRAWLENLMERELREDIVESIATSYPGAVLDSISVFNRTDVDSMLVIEYTYEAPQMFQDSGAFLVGRIPWEGRLSTQLSRIVAKPKRRSPIDLHRLRTCEIETLTVVIPDGYGIVELPTELDLKYDECRYTTTYFVEGNLLHARHEVVFDGDRVLPEDYVRFKAFLEEVLQDQRTPLLLKKTG